MRLDQLSYLGRDCCTKASSRTCKVAWTTRMHCNNRFQAIQQILCWALRPSQLGTFIGELVLFLGIFGKLLHDVELHIMKHSIRVAYAIFKAKCVCHHNVMLGPDVAKVFERYTSQFASDLVELMTMLAARNPDEITLLVCRFLSSVYLTEFLPEH